MRAGRAIRAAQRFDAWKCPNGCGHQDHEHLELAYGSPGYAPAEFHCRHDGCVCVISPSAVRAEDSA